MHHRLDQTLCRVLVDNRKNLIVVHKDSFDFDLENSVAVVEVLLVDRFVY